jgi:plastocyanin
MRALAACLLAAGLAAPAAAGELAGRVSLGVPDAHLADLGPTLVLLDADGSGVGFAVPAARPAIRQRNARFDPDFMVVVEGQTVEMPNDDTIFHNVFSFSRPNDFDLGMYPAGRSRSVTFRHAGLVRLYCSIHESMRGTVLVAPSPWFAEVSSSGDYRIADVPPGSYRLSVWNEKLPTTTRSVSVAAQGTRRVDLVLGGAAP